MFQIILRSCLLALAFASVVNCGALPNKNEVIREDVIQESLENPGIEENRDFSSEQLAPAVDGLLTSVGSYISPMLGSFKPALEGLGGLMWPALSTLGSQMAASAVNGLGNIAANLKPTSTPFPDKGDSYDAFVVKIPNYGSFMLLANPGGPMLLSSVLGNSISSSSNVQFTPQATTQQHKPQKPTFAVQKPSIIVQKPQQVFQKPQLSVPKPSVQVPKPSVVVSKPSIQKPQTVSKPQNPHPSYYGFHGHKDLEQANSNEDFAVGFHDYEEAESDLEDDTKEAFEYNGDNNDLSVLEGVSVGRVQLVPMDSEVEESLDAPEFEMEESE